MFSCRIKKYDSIWMRHLPFDLEEYCSRFERGQEFSLLVDNHSMLFTWMRDGSDGRPTPGIKAAASSKEDWNSIPRGSVIRISIPD